MGPGLERPTNTVYWDEFFKHILRCYSYIGCAQRYPQIESFHPFIDRSCHVNDHDPDINPYPRVFRIRLVRLRGIYDQCSPVIHQYSKLPLPTSKVFWNRTMFPTVSARWNLLVKIRHGWPVRLRVPCVHHMDHLFVLIIGTFSRWKRITMG